MVLFTMVRCHEGMYVFKKPRNWNGLLAYLRYAGSIEFLGPAGDVQRAGCEAGSIWAFIITLASARIFHRQATTPHPALQRKGVHPHGHRTREH
jgi:hypothetical protein